MTRLSERLAMEAEDIAAMTAEENMIPVVKLSNDFGATCYTRNVWNVGECIDFDALEADDRIRESYDGSDWSAGDYTYAENEEALFLTGTGEMLWQSRRMHDRLDRRDDITKPDSTYSFPPRTLTW